ncbi:MAG: LruC domain-containing protein [Spirochaetaceae bacterium]|nr:MAG: LruC domain-containing protein [Spirochaetaceae bacterium]
MWQAGLALLFTVIMTLAGCFFQNPAGTQVSQLTGTMPGDSVSHTLRTFSSSFAFETLLPVGVALSFVDSNSEPVAGAIATFARLNGTSVYRGRADEAGQLTSTVVLPSAPEDIILTVEHPAHETRNVTIRDMVRYASIERRMKLPASLGVQAAMTAQDLNWDGVPDEYDEFPDDPRRVFRVRIPAEDTITVAFEDLFPLHDPNDPAAFFDADFNDFVANYVVEEIYDAHNQLVEFRGQAKAVARLAGYNHRFGMHFTFRGMADLTVEYYNASGALIDTYRRENLSRSADITLFDATRNSIGYRTTFTLTFLKSEPRDGVTAAPYDPYLYVYNTRKDIHLIGQQPLPYSENPIESYDWDFRHPSNGMPWALIVPTGWIHPAELQHIEQVYPAFRYWRESFGEHYPDWYTYYQQDPGPPDVKPPALPPAVVGIELLEIVLPSGEIIFPSENGNDDPPEIGDPVMFPAKAGYQLLLEQQQAGEDLFYRVTAVEPSTVPEWILLDGDSGEVTVDTTLADPALAAPDEREARVAFYTSFNDDPMQDEGGRASIDQALEVVLRIERGEQVD